MDRVDIDNEPRGSATYYMAEAPHIYGERIYEMANLHELDIISVRMDIGLEQDASWRDVGSEEEYVELIWKTSGAEVYACVFDVVKHIEKNGNQGKLPIKIKLEFMSKRLKLQVDPDLDAQGKKQLAEFFRMLTDEDYFLDRQIELLEEEVTGIRMFSKLGKGTLVLMAILVVAWFIISDDAPDAGLTPLIDILWGFTLLLSLADGVRQQMIKRAAKRKLSDTIEKAAPNAGGGEKNE